MVILFLVVGLLIGLATRRMRSGPGAGPSR
jgi:hypothetical protein